MCIILEITTIKDKKTVPVGNPTRALICFGNLLIRLLSRGIPDPIHVGIINRSYTVIWSRGIYLPGDLFCWIDCTVGDDIDDDDWCFTATFVHTVG